MIYIGDDSVTLVAEVVYAHDLVATGVDDFEVNAVSGMPMASPVSVKLSESRIKWIKRISRIRIAKWYVR